MKKLIFTLLAFVGTMNMNAQILKVMKGDKVVATFTAEEADNFVFEEASAAPIFPFGQGEAAAKDIGNVRWIQLWENGPKFAEYKVDGTMTFADASKTGDGYIWGVNWRTPSKDEMDELLKAATSKGSSKVTCKYTQENSVWGFKFTGNTDGYTNNSLFFPAQSGKSDAAVATYWSTATGSFDFAWSIVLIYRDGEFESEWGEIPQVTYGFVCPVLNENK